MELRQLYQTEWKPVKRLKEGWSKLTDLEKQSIKNRVESLFQGDFITEEKSRIHLLQIFSFLAQVEALGSQVPLKFLDKFDEKTNSQLRVQLVDEIAHGVIFTKMAHYLAGPLFQPPQVIEAAEDFCNFIDSIENENLALICINLVAEGWIEELFKELKEWGVATEIFESILQDEERHVSEAELYTKVGLEKLDKLKIAEVVFQMETHLIDAISNGRVVRSLTELGGEEGFEKLRTRLCEKHKRQLAELNLTPSKRWEAFVSTSFNGRKVDKKYEIERGFDLYMLGKIWKAPQDPTVRTKFTLDMENVYLTENVTAAFLYAISRFIQKKFLQI